MENKAVVVLGTVDEEGTIRFLELTPDEARTLAGHLSQAAESTEE